MCPGTFHQRDTCPSAAAEAVAEPRDEFEPRRAPADHDNPMQALGLVRASNHYLGAPIRNRRVVLDLTMQHLRHRFTPSVAKSVISDVIAANILFAPFL
jgi:hypothetical protein